MLYRTACTKEAPLGKLLVDTTPIQEKVAFASSSRSVCCALISLALQYRAVLKADTISEFIVKRFILSTEKGALPIVCRGPIHSFSRSQDRLWFVPKCGNHLDKFVRAYKVAYRASVQPEPDIEY